MTTLPPQLLLLLLASKTARRSAISAARCATAGRLSPGVALVSPRGCRTKVLATATGTANIELELELIQSHMAQKPVLRGVMLLGKVSH